MTSPYLTAAEAAAYVRAPSIKAFDHWVTRRGVPCVRRGRLRLYKRDLLDQVLANDAARPRTRRRLTLAG